MTRFGEIMGSVTLYGLPACDTCRKARNWLDRFDVAYTFVDYRLGKAGQQGLDDLAQPASATQEPIQ